jgi:hypothetical protein
MARENINGHWHIRLQYSYPAQTRELVHELRLHFGKQANARVVLQGEKFTVNFRLNGQHCRDSHSATFYGLQRVWDAWPNEETYPRPIGDVKVTTMWVPFTS